VIPSEISFESEEEEGGVEGQEGEDNEGSEYRPSKRRALAPIAVPVSSTTAGTGSKGSAKIRIKVKPLSRPQPIQRQQVEPLNPPRTQIIHPAPMPLPPSRGTSRPGCPGPGPGRDIHSYTVVYYLDDIGYVDDADVKQTETVRLSPLSVFVYVADIL
jgi:hypothetical protein